ncbi:MAG: hypoxanthine phosphoribosyltransferase [Saprospiraceae bacterium]|jgi:hypoxanthine phosphoribosyltransferase|nr:hypoxanthine phosphoribosyltransferase [Saprospiraceae bacterium]
MLPMEKDVMVHGLRFRPLIAAAEIQERVAGMGAAISEAYRDKNPLFLGVLNGCFVFMADLLRHCDIACEVSFIKLSSYEGLQSSGTVKTQIGLETDIRGRHVILVEDIVDTGRTLSAFLPELKAMEPASVALASLVVKPDALAFPLHIDYVGFEIENRFIVGYGLDYNGQARNLPGIFQLAST